VKLKRGRNVKTDRNGTKTDSLSIKTDSNKKRNKKLVIYIISLG